MPGKKRHRQSVNNIVYPCTLCTASSLLLMCIVYTLNESTGGKLTAQSGRSGFKFSQPHPGTSSPHQSSAQPSFWSPTAPNGSIAPKSSLPLWCLHPWAYLLIVFLEPRFLTCEMDTSTYSQCCSCSRRQDVCCIHTPHPGLLPSIPTCSMVASPEFHSVAAESSTV